jgi:hypothetical protein
MPQGNKELRIHNRENGPHQVSTSKPYINYDYILSPIRIGNIIANYYCEFVGTDIGFI